MKKITFIAIALFCGVAFCDCAAKKPVKQAPKVDPQQAYLDSLKHAKEIRQLELELQAQEEDYLMERAAKKAEKESEMEIAKLKASNAKKATAQRLGQKIFMPCIEEGYDKPGEYMAGYGVAEGENERGAGIINANRYAIADIASKYIGMIKNGVSQYAKNVNTRSGNKVKENELEGNAEAIGTKLIDKYANAVCRDAEWAQDGTYTCYVAVHVPVQEVVNATIDELGVIQTDLDRQKFREYMQAEIDRQAAAAQAEKDEIIKLRQEAGL